MKITPELVMLALAAPAEPRAGFEPVMATERQPDAVWEGVPFDRQPKDEEEDYEGEWDVFPSKEEALAACGAEWVSVDKRLAIMWAENFRHEARLQWRWAWAVEMLEAGERYLEGRSAR